MKMSRIPLLGSLLVALPFGACDCQEKLQVLAPIIEIGDPYDPDFSVCATDQVRDCAYDFGEVGIGRPKLFSFAIKNPSTVDLIIRSVTINGGPNFTLEGNVPDIVERATGSLGKVVTVKYDPATETDEEAEVVIVSDAENLNPDENVVIKLRASGKTLGGPVIEVSPTECNFGDVGVGVRAFCDLSIANIGSVELAVTGIGFTPDTPYPMVFGPEGAFVTPTYIAAGTATSVRFYGVPNTTGLITGALTVDSTDPERPTVEVPFRIVGAQAPTAVARVKSINGASNSNPNPAVEPLDNVVLSGDQSQGQGGATIVGYAWEVLEKPSESSVTLSAPNAVDTGFRFSSAAGTVNGLDVAGTFVVRLAVTDSNGSVSTNDARVTLNAVPTEGLHIQLSWSSAENDIDLHLARGNTPDWCSPNDCYYGNCTFIRPNWDSVAGTAGDPSLDIDDLDGFGPENTNIERPVNGTYIIGVHAYDATEGSDFEPTDVTVKVFVGGALADEFYGRLESIDDFWTVAKVVVNGTTTVQPLDSNETDWTCF